MASKKVGNDLEVEQDNVEYPGNPLIKTGGAALKVETYTVGKNPLVKDVANQTDRPDRKLS